jgi:hypothetical protein
VSVGLAHGNDPNHSTSVADGCSVVDTVVDAASVVGVSAVVVVVIDSVIGDEAAVVVETASSLPLPVQPATTLQQTATAVAAAAMRDRRCLTMVVSPRQASLMTGSPPSAR